MQGISRSPGSRLSIAWQSRTLQETPAGVWRKLNNRECYKQETPDGVGAEGDQEFPEAGQSKKFVFLSAFVS